MSQSPIVAFGARFAPSANGAGRLRDYIWPDFSNFQNNSNLSTRNGLSVNGAAISNIGYAGGAGNRTNVRNQRPCIDIHASGALGVGNGVSLGRGADVLLATLKTGNFVPYGFSDAQCWRVYFIASLNNIPAHEVSMSLAATNSGSNSGTPVTANIDSFGWTFNNGGGVDFFTHVAGVQTTTPATPTQAGGYDITAVHVYELVMVGATRFTDATLRAAVDGITVALPATSSSWGPGTKLPAQASVDVANAGYWVGMGNIAGNGLSTDLSIYECRVMCGPTLASLY